jgi:hypothetical protein
MVNFINLAIITKKQNNFNGGKNMVESVKEYISFSVDGDICLSFRKKCLDKGQSYSEAITELMTEYIKRK